MNAIRMLALTLPLATLPIAFAQSAPTPAPIAPTLSLGEPTRTAKLESDVPEMRYQNGFFFTSDIHGRVHIFDKDGHLKANLTLKPQEEKAVPWATHDVALFKDGSIVASWLYMMPGERRHYLFLIHYDPAGNFIEQIDLGQWRAMNICIADDKSIWTLSGKEGPNYPIYSPDEGILRSYKFGVGLQQAVVPWSNFGNNGRFVYGKNPIDCSGDKIHALVNDKWIEYTPGADFTLTQVEPLSHSVFGGSPLPYGFAYISASRAYELIKQSWGESYDGMLAELLPSPTNEKTLRWVEVPADKAIPANIRPPDSAATTPDSVPTTPNKAKKPIVLTHLYGADHDDGEQLVYRTSASDTVLWSHPTFGSLSSTTAKPLAFDVISIRPSEPGSRMMISPTTTPDGYRATGQSMLTTIMIAYFPQDAAYWWSKNRLSGAPAWLSQQYNINAKVSNTDLAEWQKQGASLDKKPMFLAMLQTMLADRCHLVAHMVPGPPQPGWSLELGKHAPHLTESKPGEALPEGMKLPDGGVSVPYQRGDKPRLALYAATVADLAQMLSTFAGQPVQDHTGLTGHYDFVIDWIGYPDSKVSVAYKERDDPDPLSRWNIEALGLRYIPINIPDETLVIDHIEPPSEN